jgi:uncharacterized protein YfaS (alpha-2-macroglobulin family)
LFGGDILILIKFLLMGLRKLFGTIILLFVLLFVRAQPGATDYDRRWQVVDSLDKAGLPETALTVINRIYVLARQEHNDGQEIKALIYRITVSQQKRENGDTTSIAELEEAAAGAGQPSRSVLQSLLAGLYRNYLTQNRYKLYNRTATVNFVKTDIATWGVDDFHHRVNSLYLASLQDEKLLKQVPVENYEPILIKGNMRYLRPTLFDLLAHEALDYFKSSETDINQPGNVFVIDDSVVFADAAVFADHSFRTADTSSAHYTALLLYQRLIRLHLADPQPDGLIDVDIDRLRFAKNYAVLDDKDELYGHALARITDHYDRLPAAAQAWYLQAQDYVTETRHAWNSRDSTFHNGIPAARAICDKVLSERDSSEGKTNCQILLDDILRKNLNIEMEEFNLPGEPFRSLVTWANVNRIYVRLVRTDSLREYAPSHMSEDYWRQRLRLPVYRAFVRDLPPTGDYLTHSAEIPIGSLPPGAYTLLCSTDSGWDRKKGVTTAQEFHVTSIAYICQDRDYFVVNRETGKPLSGATVQVWQRAYTSGNNTWQLTEREVYHSDAQGHFRLQNRKTNDGYGQSFLEISIPGDDLFLPDINIPYWVGQDERDTRETDKEKYENENGKVYLFMDRSIYRPGQTVYFKGIVVTKDFNTRQPKVWAGRETMVMLYNANDEKVDSLTLVTYEFGSYHGTFRLPEHLLNGNFRIGNVSPFSQQYFSVEEYKRPRFSVAFDRLNGSYRVGDSIRVKGGVEAYAGNSLDGAVVKYRITREASYSRYRFFGRGRMLPQNSQEIAHGELKTDANGDFHLSFAALPDRSIPAASNPRFHYRVEADVTDINGETRSGTADFVAGYTVLDLSIWLPGVSPFTADKLKYLEVNAVNLSGEPVPSKVHVAAYPLRAPNRLIRERQWSTPDLQVMSEAAFLDSFPHDQYREELKKENWPRGPMAWEATDSTGDRQIPVRLSPGWWVIEATVSDTYGQVVKDERYVEVQDETGRPVSPQYVWGGESQAVTVVTPGGKAVVETGSSAADVFVIRKIERPGEPQVGYSSFTLSNGKNSSEWMVTEVDRGGFGLSDAFVKDNRLYMHGSLVRVPWTNKQLQIRYTTYRNKTEPGSGEKWAVTIAGDKGAQASAQVLTAMYDASLDQFRPQSWSAPNLYPEMEQAWGWGGGENFKVCRSRERGWFGVETPVYDKRYDRLLRLETTDNYNFRSNKFEFLTVDDQRRVLPGVAVDARGNVTAQGQRVGTVPVNGKRFNAEGHRDEVVVSDTVQYEVRVRGIGDEEQGAAPSAPPVQVRTNFNETAFFYPDLRTDSAGAVSFSFTMPESLTQWKWMTLAHTRDLAFGYSSRTVVTQKELMVQPNAPRFLREGDKINLSVKVVNLTDSEMTGQMGLALTDPTTGEPADGWFINRQPNQYFTVPGRGSAVVEFPLDIPYQYNRPLSYRVVAQAGAYSDGEEAVLPVVSNRMLVTETLPLNMPGDGVRYFKFGKLLASGSSETLNHHALTVEFTANPAWYAVQALPYLMEFPFECAEQTFDRLYANAVASKIVSGSQRIAQVFASWRTEDTSALLSNLEKNQQLKSVLLEETPWVLEGKTETQQKKNIALLFDLTRLSGQLESTVDQLHELQAADGGFPWFKGGLDDRYVTQYILTGLGRLQRMQALSPALEGKIKNMIAAALDYADREITKDYQQDLKAQGGVHLISPFAAQYLYMRSLFNDVGIPGGSFAAVNYYRKVAQQQWVKASKYVQGMVALALFRTGDVATAQSILASLRETAIRNEELGMYWKGMEGGYYWYQAPVETEALMIEAFREIGHDTVSDRQLKTWLLRQKQTHRWATTKATADACYALLMDGTDWLDQERMVTIQLGEKQVELMGEAGTGYFSKIFDAPFIDTSMGHIKVSMSSSRGGGSPAWGAVYWQYFDQLDQITAAERAKAPLRVEKSLFVQRNTDRGPVLDTIPDNGTLHVGDRVVVRIVLRSDRDLEYVHLKDMRGACLEPVNVLSGYRWQGGLGYYESTKDVSTEFFFPSVPKGVYVFEYPLVVEQTGEYSNGVASVECMYAPEFAFHTEGIRINVEGGQ